MALEASLGPIWVLLALLILLWCVQARTHRRSVVRRAPPGFGVQRWVDPELEQLKATWRRRGELLIAAGFTGMFTWLAASVPTAAVTNVDIWPPLLFAAGVAGLGTYAIVAVETGRLWLPGRDKVKRGAVDRARTAKMAELRERSSARRDVAARPISEDLPPISPTKDYQVAAVRAAMAAFSAPGVNQFDVLMLHSALARIERTKNPLFEPLAPASCMEGRP